MIPNTNSTKLVLFWIFMFVLVRISTLMETSAQNTSTRKLTEVKVGVVLDSERFVGIGKLGLSCIQMGLRDFYVSHPYFITRLVLHSRNSNGDVVSAAASALDLIKNVEVQAIIGPESSMQANFVINLGQKAQVPIISFSATSPSLASLRSPYFFRVTQNDSSQVRAISAIVRAFGWKEVVPIYVDNEFGEGIIPYLTDALQQVDARVSYRSVIPQSPSDDQIVTELYRLRTMQTRVFVVHTYPNLGSQIFTKAKEIGMMEQGYVWIMTDGITNCLSSIDPSIIDHMQGVLGIKTYIPRTKDTDNFSFRWKRKLLRDNISRENHELDVFGLWAYDAVWALALAVEKAGITNIGYKKSNASNIDLETLGVNQNGQKLKDTLSNTRFQGLSGEFKLINGQLESPTFQILNVNGNGGRGIGFWTPQTGLTKNLDTKGISAYSTSKESLGTIIWPGDSISIPKGWEIPTNGKKLRIGVPVKVGFGEFVTVKRDPITNATQATGYCIDVFKAVLEALPYVISYEFIPFEKPNGRIAGTYDELVYQVYLGNFDAVVGDVTIVANRSLYIDFTLPFTESGVSMVVPIKDNSRKNAWVFLKPLTWDLWVTSGCFFVFIGSVVWLLEHRINCDFRGPPSHQIGTSLWFSFSTMVFSQRETVISNLARFVVIVWFFVVFILTQSYTASLTSLLTVQQLQPTVTDVNQLLKKGEHVGYLEGSFVYGILKSLKFDNSKLLTYKSSKEMDELFSKGSANGGIAAAFDEIPYLRLFLSDYPSKYTMEDPRYKTGGFGFVFPINSPLVADISRAILNVTEGEKMTQIENKWFGKQSRSPPSANKEVDSTSLSLESFWGLFAIAGLTSVLALVISLAMFLHKERHIIQNSDSKSSIWKRIGVAVRRYDQKDLSSHTFRSDAHNKSGNISSVHSTAAVPIENCPSIDYQSTPSVHASIQTDPNFELAR